MGRAIVAGHICLDLSPHLRDGIPLNAGALNPAGPCSLDLGGAAPNVGLVLASLGTDVTLYGAIAADPFGHIIELLLSEFPVPLRNRLRFVDAYQTSYSMVVSTPSLDRAFIHHRGANDHFDFSWLSTGTLKTASALYVGYPPLLQAARIGDGLFMSECLKKAKRLGLKTIVDMSASDPTGFPVDWRKWRERVLPYCDVFAMSESDADGFFDRSYDSPVEAGEMVLDEGAKVVILKLGHRGLLGVTAKDVGDLPDSWSDRTMKIPAFEVDVMSTNGAGDAAVAGVIHGAIEGYDFENTLKLAAAAGALRCMAVTEWNLYPRAETLLNFATSSWKPLHEA